MLETCAETAGHWTFTIDPVVVGIYAFLAVALVAGMKWRWIHSAVSGLLLGLMVWLWLL